MTTTDTTTATTAWAAFDKTTSRWGRLTMIAAMIIMIGGPGIIAAQLGVKPLSILAGVLAIAAVFGAVWFVEPLSYFPILGAASMYQAFMIGNISNKLLPAAIVAQATIEAKPETKRGQLAAVLAICGAAAMHLTTLAILVGIFGTLIIRAIPAATITSVQTFVLPAVIGAVLVQMVVSNPKFRILTIAVVVALVVQLVLVPLFPILTNFAIAIAVVATILLAIFVPAAAKDATPPPDTIVKSASDDASADSVDA